MSSSSAKSSSQLPAIEVADQPFVLSFARVGDRLSHAISRVGASGNADIVLHSVEGTSADDWPTSTALQNLSIEELTPNQPVALLVGMAGKSHWSASIERLPTGDGWLWDVACRFSTPPQFLGSTYQLPSVKEENRAGEWSPTITLAGSSDPASLKLKIDESFSLRVTAIAIPGKTPGEFTCCTLQASDGRFRLVPTLHATTGPTTFRWKYRIEVLAS